MGNEAEKCNQLIATLKISDVINEPVVLTPDAMIQFAREGVFPHISHGMISDKSKANLLGKGLICIQVIWFLIQCIARAAAGYPLTLLEVHTMVHVVCALLMYALWWEVSLQLLEKCCVSSSSSCRNLRMSVSQLCKMYLVL